ncbi:hypothetical protein F511_12320 [Dorcoceras hygrometricum]|uniref:Uncharacterized protein n=1 Tax=Dorcoceras hygrometricum TaxID=472368 RepID=A0A2Z7BHL1_9LAMI|nr:hypothetical protein F511_12320 [Dorcoceras hygrometricum]
MFQALESSGLRGFLGCNAEIYEEDIQTFFSNSRLEGNTMINTVRGSSVAISEDMFSGLFRLPTEGLVVISELPERLVAQMRLEFSESRILKAMVVPSTKKAQGFDVQLSLLLKGVLRLKLDESTTLPFLRILSSKSVGTYLAKDKSAMAESIEEKKFSAVKRKRTTIGRATFLATVSESVYILVVHPSVQVTETIPNAVFRAFQHEQRAEKFCGFFEDGTHAESFNSLSACEPIEVVYEESYPAQIDHNFIDSNNASSFAQTTAQLRDLVSSITSEKFQSQDLLSSFKSDFAERMKSLELSIEYLRTSHMALVNKQWRQHLDLLRRGDKLKADLSSEILLLELCYMKRHRNNHPN